MTILPDILLVGPAAISTGTLTALLGALTAYLLAGRLASRDGAAASEAAQSLVLNMAIGALVGARVVYLLMDPAAYLASPRLLLSPPNGPLALPAGAAGGFTGLGWGLWRQGHRSALLDRVFPAMVTGAAVAALGFQGEGAWAWAPCLGAAALGALALQGWSPALRAHKAAPPGYRAAASAMLTAVALVLADLARPASDLPGGVSFLQLASALAGTGAWLWSQRLPL